MSTSNYTPIHIDITPMDILRRANPRTGVVCCEIPDGRTGREAMPPAAWGAALACGWIAPIDIAIVDDGRNGQTLKRYRYRVTEAGDRMLGYNRIRENTHDA